MVDQEGPALVEVHRSWVDRRESPAGVDGAHQAAVVLDDVVLVRRPAAKPDRRRWWTPPRPVGLAPSHGDAVVGHQAPDPFVEVIPPDLVGGDQRQLVGGAPEVRQSHERVRRVDHRCFRRSGEDLVGMGHQPLVELILTGYEHRERTSLAAPGAP